MTHTTAFSDTLEARVQILRMLPHNAKLALVKEASASWDSAWLEPILVSGWLRPTAILNLDENDLKSSHDEWLVRALALFYFLPRIEFGVQKEDPLLGVLEPPLQVLSYQTEEINRLFFLRVLKEMVEYLEFFRDSPCIAQVSKNAVAHLLVATVVLDMPEHLKDLTVLFPGLQKEDIHISWLGGSFGEFINNASNHNRGLREQKNTSDDQVNAVNVALRLSREACLDVLLEANPNALDTLGSIHGDKVWTLNNFHKYYPYHCSPSLIARVQNVNMETVEECARTRNRWTTFLAPCAPLELAQKQSPLVADSKSPYFLAMVRSGVYDKRPEESLAIAVSHAHMELVQRLLPLVKDWGLMEKLFAPEGSPLVRAAEWTQYKAFETPISCEQIERVMMAFINGCLERDQRFILNNERINSWFGKGTVVEPFWSMAKWNCHGLMLKFLAEGTVDLQMLCQPGTPEPMTLMDALDLEASASAAVVRSFLARQRAHGLLDGMDTMFRVPTDADPAMGTLELQI